MSDKRQKALRRLEQRDRRAEALDRKSQTMARRTKSDYPDDVRGWVW